jgi:hypothetical protein
MTAHRNISDPWHRINFAPDGPSLIPPSIIIATPSGGSVSLTASNEAGAEHLLITHLAVGAVADFQSGAITAGEKVAEINIGVGGSAFVKALGPVAIGGLSFLESRAEGYSKADSAVIAGSASGGALVGAELGAEGGAAIGLGIGAVFPPAEVVTVPAGTIIGAIAGAILGAFTTTSAVKAALGPPAITILPQGAQGAEITLTPNDQGGATLTATPVDGFGNPTGPTETFAIAPPPGSVPSAGGTVTLTPLDAQGNPTGPPQTINLSVNAGTVTVQPGQSPPMSVTPTDTGVSVDGAIPGANSLPAGSVDETIQNGPNGSSDTEFKFDAPPFRVPQPIRWRLMSRRHRLRSMALRAQ